MIYEYFSYLCTRKHETGAALQATHPCFLVRGCFARCTRKHETGAALRATHPCFLVRRSTRNGNISMQKY